MNTQVLTAPSKAHHFIFRHLLSVMDHPFRYRLSNPKKLVQAAGIRAGHVVLEVGCGSGFFTEAAAALVGDQGRLQAIDREPLAVEATAKKIQERRLKNAYVTCADAQATGFAEGSFDVILLYGLIPAPGIIDERRLISEMHRLLKPTGIVAVWTAVPFWSPRSITKTTLLTYCGKQDRVHRFSKGQ